MSSKVNRFEALDAWRGICALIVALEHLNIANVLHDNALVHHGYRFVDFFFVLSGFVIAHAYRERLQRGGGEVSTFLIRRIGRLWPLHVSVLLGFVIFELCILLGSHVGISMGRPAFTERNTLATIPANLALIHSWGFTSQLSWNNPSWSISTEVFAYGLFAFTCATFARWLDTIAIILVTAAGAVLLFVAPLGMKSTFDFGLVRCVFGFMMGVLVRSLWERVPLRLGTAGELAISIAVFAGVVLLPSDAPALLITPLFALAVWIFAGEAGALSRLLRRAGPQKLGAWSYSIYMVHALVVVGLYAAALMASRYGIALFRRIDDVSTIVGSPAVTTAITLGYLVVLVGLARITYRHIELRGQRWVETRTRRRT